MYRMQDWACSKCGYLWEEIHLVGDPSAKHCDKDAKKVAGAPHIDRIKPHFSVALGKKVSGFRDLESRLKAEGCYVPTNNEMHTPLDKGNPEPQVDRKKIREVAEKTYSALRLENQI